MKLQAIKTTNSITAVACCLIAVLLLTHCKGTFAITEQDNAQDVSADVLTSPALPEEAPKEKTKQEVLWSKSYEDALQTASNQNKPVMAIFYEDWATSCQHLHNKILTSSDVIKESAKFVNLRVDCEKQTELAELFKIYALPTIIFFDGDGNVLWRLEGTPDKSSTFVAYMENVHKRFVAKKKKSE